MENTYVCISILIPTYNVEDTIERSLDSCLNQDFSEPYEIVIVDDGSTDKTLEIITRYICNSNISIKVYQKEHAGISDALNYGLSLCSGRYIVRMDADDYMLEDRLSIQYNYIKSHANIDLLCNNITRYHNNENIGNSEIVDKYITKDDFTKVGYNFIVHPTFFFSKTLYDDIVDRFGYFYNNEYNGAEDYELLLRLLDNNYKVYIDHKIVLNYTVKDKTEDYEKLQYHLCNKLNYKYNTYNIQNKHIGIYYISTGIYNQSFPDFLLSIKDFFPGIKKTIILLSDQLNEYDNYYDELSNTHIIYKYLKHLPWPLITLFKMNTILENKGNYDYIFYFNANSFILKSDYSWFNPNKLILTYHKDWFGNKCNTSKFLSPYLDNPNSVSYIGTKDYTYVQGAFFGGNAKLVYEMCESVSEMLQEDLINNIIPRWHDETYLNKYAYIYDYNRNNKISVENCLISEIWYDRNNLSNIDSTQFILLKENIYNLSENNKADKLSKLLPYHYLQPLYNYDNIYEYENKYPETSELSSSSTSNVNLICLYLTNELTEETFNKIFNILFSFDNKQYHILLYFDSRSPYRERILNIDWHDNIHIFYFDIVNILASITHIDYMYNIYKFNSVLYPNVLYLLCYDYINNLHSDKFKYIYILHESQSLEFFNTNNLYSNVLHVFDTYVDSDLLDITNKVLNLSPDEFINHKQIKQYNLFKYKNRYKHCILNNTSVFRLSYRAFEFLHNVKNVLKHEPYIYSIPTLLKNYHFSIYNDDKNNNE